ncbi:MAG: hypothetical protein Q4B03_00730 [Lachnospiraceae bacterium]|nr:hypothetical protein [Lachnospiraceae bacterium]
MREVLLITAFAMSIVVAFIINLALRKAVTNKITVGCVLFAFLAGGCIYGVGMAQVCANSVIATERAFLAILGMFLGRNDYSTINSAELMKLSWVVPIFWLAHICAFYVTASAVFANAGAGLVRRIRVLVARWRDIAVIYGADDHTLSFARNLNRDHNNLSVVFVDEDTDHAQAVEREGFLFRSDSDALEPSDRFLKGIGLRPGKRKITLYAISENHENNYKYAGEFLNILERRQIDPDQTAAMVITEDHNELMSEAVDGSYGYGSACSCSYQELISRLLIQRYPTWDQVTFSPEGKAVNDFNCLVIGLGKTGQNVLLELIMNGQFEGSHFRADVFAGSGTDELGSMMYRAPEVFTAYEIHIHRNDARSRELYAFLEERGDKLKYAAICTGNEKLNREIAVELDSFFKDQELDIPVCICGKQVYRLGDIHHNIYTPDLLVPELQDTGAKKINQVYCSSNGRSEQENWASCDSFSRRSCRAAWSFRGAFVKASTGTPVDQISGKKQENLSRTEHLRWCAFHRCNGFQLMSREEVLARARRIQEGESIRLTKTGKRHACLMMYDDLEQLDEIARKTAGQQTDYRGSNWDNVRILLETEEGDQYEAE